MGPFKKWGQRKIQICRFRQAENERERERGSGGKEETGLWEETRVCKQGLRLSVCWGLSSEVDDALGEQLRCRAFRLHHYCSPSSSSSNNARTHARACATHRSTCAALIKMQQRRRKKEISDCCISALASAPLWSGFACLAGQRNQTKSESHMVMVNLAACTVVLKPLWKQSDEKSWKKKRNSEASVMTHFQCAAACWENLVEESRDRGRWNRRRGQTDVLSQMALLVLKGHCTHCFYSNLSQMNFPLQTVFKGKQSLFKRSLTKYKTSNTHEYQLWNRSLLFPPSLPSATPHLY